MENMMTTEEYFAQRVDEQINWFDKKSSTNKKMFMFLRATEIVLALLVPFLAGYVHDIQGLVTFFIGILSIIVAAIASILTLYKFQENWIEYRMMAEALKYEKFLFLAKAGPYKDEVSFANFVERIENILSKENAKWSVQNLSQKENLLKKEAQD
jgi:hypothetical protein